MNVQLFYAETAHLQEAEYIWQQYRSLGSGALLYVSDSPLERLRDYLGFLTQTPVLLFPAYTHGDSERLKEERLKTLFYLKKQPTPDAIVLAKAEGLAQPFSEALVNEEAWRLECGQTIPHEVLRTRCIQWGYCIQDLVHCKGDMAFRGGIVDLFSPFEKEPCRLDFFGDTLEGIKTFDVMNQRTNCSRDSYTLIPSDEKPESGEGRRLEELFTFKKVKGRCDAKQIFGEGMLSSFPPFQGERVGEALRTYLDAQRSQKVVYLTGETLEARDAWSSFCKAYHLPFCPLSAEEVTAIKGLYVRPCSSEALMGAGDGVIVLPSQLFWVAKGARTSRERTATLLEETAGFMPGDLLIHEDHGVGRYEKLEPILVEGQVHDCIAITYADGGRLLLPIENLGQVTPYGLEPETVRLDKLGSNSWQIRQKKARKKAELVAQYLIENAAARSLITDAGLKEPPSDAYVDFVRGFPFVETEDQLRAIDETLEDLERDTPMDRLICGDVGFGKTEVALRASFRMVESGQQVALISPTTLLSRQHYETFRQRFSGTPFRVAHLSRLVKASVAKSVYDDLQAGAIDIVIGTHALLNKKLAFHNIGLLIIDEEQHFGVKQKEALKSLQQGVNVLTLTATPIPRTLQMSMRGLKDTSVITTPPVNRLPIQTHLEPYRKELLREVLSKERERGGQSFIVCPRLTHLHILLKDLQDVVPELSVLTAHGQLSADELDNVITTFEGRGADILLSTNIIEAGIDITNAGTLIVYRADLFGLAQLYQIRGRVGRGNQEAFAYLTTPSLDEISFQATRRLKTLCTLDYLGAGFALAGYDMDLRGVGNLVGEQQAGHAHDVGVAYYNKLLQESILKRRVQENEENATAMEGLNPQIQGSFSMSLPEAYVPALNLRMGLYRRLAGLQSIEQLEAFEAELVDRFGPLPPPAHHLLQVMHMRILAKEVGVEKLVLAPQSLHIHFYEKRFLNPEGLLQLIQKNPIRYRLRQDQSLSVFLQGEEAFTCAKNFLRLLTSIAKK